MADDAKRYASEVNSDKLNALIVAARQQSLGGLTPAGEVIGVAGYLFK